MSEHQKGCPMEPLSESDDAMCAGASCTCSTPQDIVYVQSEITFMIRLPERGKKPLIENQDGYCNDETNERVIDAISRFLPGGGSVFMDDETVIDVEVEWSDVDIMEARVE